MNELSQWILAASIADGASAAAGVVGGFVVLGAAVAWFFNRMDADFNGGKLKPISARALFLGTALLVVAFMTPSSKTILMIAASEGSEAVATSPEGQAILADLRKIIANLADGVTP